EGRDPPMPSRNASMPTSRLPVASIVPRDVRSRRFVLAAPNSRPPFRIEDSVMVLLLERAGPGSERGLDRPPVAEPAHHGVEDRRQEDAEQGHADHAGEDRRPEGAPHLGPGPLGDHQWEYAEDERE